MKWMASKAKRDYSECMCHNGVLTAKELLRETQLASDDQLIMYHILLPKPRAKLGEDTKEAS